MANTLNVQLGVCSVSFNGVDLGHTKGGCEFTYEPSHTDITVDQWGETPINKILIGEKVLVKVPLAEFTIANLKVSMPETTFAGAANARITGGKQTGAKATDTAAQLVLHPISEGTRRHDIVIYKAYVSSPIQINHKIDEVKVIEVEFGALIDESKSNGNQLFLIGDSTA